MSPRPLVLLLAALTVVRAGFAQATVPYVITTVAGQYPLGDGGPARSALLQSPNSVVVLPNGDIYVTDPGNLRIRRVTPAGTIDTVVEGGVAQSLTVDSTGAFYFTDGFAKVYRMSAAGQVVTVAGSSEGFSGDDGQATAAKLSRPAAAISDGKGNIYVSDTGNHRIRQIRPDGTIRTLGGSNTRGSAGDNGPVTLATFDSPGALALDRDGSLYVVDRSGTKIRKIDSAGTITALFAGTSLIIGLFVDKSGTFYYTDASSVWKRNSAGTFLRIAGQRTLGYGGDGGPAEAAQLDHPSGLGMTEAGELLVADRGNHIVRKVDSAGVINAVIGRIHFAGDGGKATEGLLNRPGGVAVDGGRLLIADTFNQRIRVVGTDGLINTFAGTGRIGLVNVQGAAKAADLFYPEALTFDAKSNLYLTADNQVYKISPEGTITLVAGTGAYGDQGDGGLAINAKFWYICGLAADAAGNLYISDYLSSKVRKVSADGIVSAYAGTGEWGLAGDGGLATAAELNGPGAIVLDKEGNLYIADQDSNKIRKVTPGSVISTFAGAATGTYGHYGDGGQAKMALLAGPWGLAIDTAGNLYVSEEMGDYIRKISPTGIISTIAGNGRTGFSGDGDLATAASLSWPAGMAVDANGDVYVADRRNNRIRKLTLNPPSKLEIAGGDGQSGVAGEALKEALRVRVIGRAGVGLPQVAVTFAVTSGAATLSATSTMTDGKGVAGVAVTLGPSPGTVAVTATVAGLGSIRFTLIATPPPPPPPVVLAPRITRVAGAPGSVPPVSEISQNALVTILGENFADTGTDALVTADDFLEGRLPTNFRGVCVTVGGQAAPLLRVTPTRIDIQAPSLALLAEVAVRVAVNCGKTNEVKSSEVSVPLKEASPEFFYFVQNPDGKNPIRAANTGTGVNVGVPDLVPGAGFEPAKPGDTIALVATGFGATDPQMAAGEVPAQDAPVVAKVAVLLGDLTLAETDLVFCGVVKGNPGVYRLEIKIPEDVPDGDVPVVVRVGESSSPSGGYITVRRP